MKEQKSKWKEIAMVCGIAVMFAILVFTGIYAFYEEPKYDDFCSFRPYDYKTIPSTCTYPSGENVDSCIKAGGSIVFDYDAQGCQVFKECDMCSVNYNDAREKFNRNVFLIAAPLGLIAVIVGLLILLDFIGVGFMFGGILTLIIATGQYFSDMSRQMRFIVILIEFALLLYIAYKKVRKTPENKARK